MDKEGAKAMTFQYDASHHQHELESEAEHERLLDQHRFAELGGQRRRFVMVLLIGRDDDSTDPVVLDRLPEVGAHGPRA